MMRYPAPGTVHTHRDIKRRTGVWHSCCTLRCSSLLRLRLAQGASARPMDTAATRTISLQLFRGKPSHWAKQQALDCPIALVWGLHLNGAWPACSEMSNSIQCMHRSTFLTLYASRGTVRHSLLGGRQPVHARHGEATPVRERLLRPCWAIDGDACWANITAYAAGLNNSTVITLHSINSSSTRSV